MIGLFQFCLKLNKIFAKIIIKLCIKLELKKKVFTCTPEYFTVFTPVYIKMCLCDQVYFVIC